MGNALAAAASAPDLEGGAWHEVIRRRHHGKPRTPSSAPGCVEPKIALDSDFNVWRKKGQQRVFVKRRHFSSISLVDNGQRGGMGSGRKPRSLLRSRDSFSNVAMPEQVQRVEQQMLDLLDLSSHEAFPSLREAAALSGVVVEYPRNHKKREKHHRRRGGNTGVVSATFHFHAYDDEPRNDEPELYHLLHLIKRKSVAAATAESLSEAARF